MNAESSRLRSTGRTSSTISAIWAGALLVVYLAATGVLLLHGRSRVAIASVVLHLALLGAVAAATWLKGVPGWLRSWAPLLSLLLLYGEMPLLIAAAGGDRLFDGTVLRWEQAVFGGQPAREWAVRWPWWPLSELLHAAYLSYYPLIYSVPAVLYLTGRRDEFHEAAFALLLTFVTCYGWFVVFPVAGPRYLWPAPPGHGAVRSFAHWLLEVGSSRGTAFPSSHVAVAVTQSILAIRYFGARGAWVGVMTVGLALGAVYGGFHYAIDVVAGAAVGVLATAVALLATAPWRRQANAMAPT